MKYALLLPVIVAHIMQSTPAFAFAESSQIQTYTNKYNELTILGQKFSTHRMRTLYSGRGYSSIWFTSAGANRRLQTYLKFIRGTRVDSNTRSLLNVVNDLNSRLDNKIWVSLELVTTQSLLSYLNSQGVTQDTNLLKVLYRAPEDFLNYLKNPKVRTEVVPMARPVETAPLKVRPVHADNEFVQRPAPSSGVGGRMDIQKFTTSYDSLKISGSIIYTDQLRKLYGLRDYRSLWFENGQKSDRISSLLSFVKYQENNGTDVKEFWLPMTSNASMNYEPSKWITLEMLASHVLVTYLNARGVSEYSELNKAINLGTSEFMFYVRNLRNKDGVIPKAIPVEDPQDGPILRARPVNGSLTDIAMPAAPIGVSNSRFANDPVTADVAKFNEVMPQLIFSNSSGRPNTLAAVLRDTLRSSNRHGLNPDDYWGAGMEKVYISQTQGFEQYARYAMLRYVNHLYGGRIDATKIDENLLRFERRNFADYKTLAAMLSASDVNLKSALDSLAPTMPQYKQLMRNLAMLQTLKSDGVWRKILQPKHELKMGQSSLLVAEIRLQLAYLGYQNTGASEIFDESFDALTKDYLKSNGIPSKLDYRFYASMGKSVDERILQVQVNLEKLRWIPRVYRDRFVFINTAAQEINLIDNGLSIMKFRTVNGKAEKPTPSMLQQSKRVILNPTWTVPLRIAAEDKVPLFREDLHNYLKTKNMFILSAGSREYLDVRTLVPEKPLPGEFEYQARLAVYNQKLEKFLSGFTQDTSTNKYYIVQGPGNLNALGVLKFPLQDMNGNPNSADIYLHDTNERELFDNAVRYNSSGCIRLQYPLDFAAELLKGKGWTVDDIKARVPWNDPTAIVAEADTQQSVSLDKPLLVYIVYLTSDQNDDGSVRLFEDFYGLDAKIIEALRASH